MRVLLFLNELSCATGADEATADAAMVEFVEVVRHVRRKRAETGLVTARQLRHVELARGYTVEKWIGQHGRNRERWRALQNARNRSPFSAAFAEGAPAEVEYTHEGRSAEALGSAHLSDGIAVSLPVEPRWRTSWVVTDRVRAVEDADGPLRLAEDSVHVRHAAARADLDEHDEWMSSTGLSGLTSGDELWSARADFFPHLRFLARAADQVRKLDRGFLRPVADELVRLERAAAGWDPAASPEPRWGSKVTPESETREKHCWFTGEDGRSHLYGLHARFTPGAGRIHFRLLPQEGSLEIAHVGWKLGAS